MKSGQGFDASLGLRCLSGHLGKVRGLRISHPLTAAAIIPSMCQALQFRLGKMSYHTVFEGELVGMLLALHLLARQRGVHSVLITLDNQAAMTALQNNIPQASHYLLDHIHDMILCLKRKHCCLHIHLEWVPGHRGVGGNEPADCKAKAAVEGLSSMATELPLLLHHHLPASMAAFIAHRRTMLLQRWRDEWLSSPQYSKVAKVDSLLPSRKSSKPLVTSCIRP